jgi:hypothetical protein
MAIYNIRDYNGQTISDISGTIVDSGGDQGSYNTRTTPLAGDYQNNENFYMILDVPNANSYRFKLEDLYTADSVDVLRVYRITSKGTGPVTITDGVPQVANGWNFNRASFSPFNPSFSTPSVTTQIFNGDGYCTISSPVFSGTGTAEDTEFQATSQSFIVTWFSNISNVGRGFKLSYRSNLVQDETFSNLDNLFDVQTTYHFLSNFSALTNDTQSVLTDEGYIKYYVSSSIQNPVITLYSDELNNRGTGSWPRETYATVEGNIITMSYDMVKRFIGWEPRTAGVNNLRAYVVDKYDNKKKDLMTTVDLSPNRAHFGFPYNFAYNNVVQNQVGVSVRTARETDPNAYSTALLRSPSGILGFQPYLYNNANWSYSPNMYSFKVFDCTSTTLIESALFIHELKLGNNDSLSVYRFSGSMNATVYDQVRNQTFTNWELISEFSGTFKASLSNSNTKITYLEGKAKNGYDYYYAITLKTANSTDGDGFLATLKPTQQLSSRANPNGGWYDTSFSLGQSANNEMGVQVISAQNIPINKTFTDIQFLLSNDGNIENATWSSGSYVSIHGASLYSKYYTFGNADSSRLGTTAMVLDDGNKYLHGLKEVCILTNRTQSFLFNSKDYVGFNTYHSTPTTLQTNKFYLNTHFPKITNVSYRSGSINLILEQQNLLQNQQTNKYVLETYNGSSFVSYASGFICNGTGSTLESATESYKKTILTASTEGGVLSVEIDGKDLYDYPALGPSSHRYLGTFRLSPYYESVDQSSYTPSITHWYGFQNTFYFLNSTINNRNFIINRASELMVNYHNQNSLQSHNDYSNKYFYLSKRQGVGNNSDFMFIRPFQSTKINDIYVYLNSINIGGAGGGLSLMPVKYDRSGRIFKNGFNPIYNSLNTLPSLDPAQYGSQYNYVNTDDEINGIGAPGRIRSLAGFQSVVKTSLIDGAPLQDYRMFIGLQSASIGDNVSNKVLYYDTVSREWGLAANVGSTLNSINALLISGSDLYVGGDFTTLGGTTTQALGRRNSSLNVTTVIRNGTGVGLGNSTYTGQLNTSGVASVYDLHLSGNEIYVAGAFDKVFTVSTSAWQTVNNIIKYNPQSASYYSLNGTALTAGSLNGLNGAVYTIARSGSTLFVGGDFTSGSANRETWNIGLNRVARYTTAGGWSRIASGTNGRVNSIAVSGNYLYIGGAFTALTRSNGTTTSATNLAKYNIATNDWETLSSAISGVNGEVLKVVYDSASDAIHVGGRFTTFTDGIGATVNKSGYLSIRRNFNNNDIVEATRTIGNTALTTVRSDTGTTPDVHAILPLTFSNYKLDGGAGASAWLGGSFRTVHLKSNNTKSDVVNYLTYLNDTDSADLLNPDGIPINYGKQSHNLISSEQLGRYKFEDNSAIFAFWNGDISFDLSCRIVEPPIRSSMAGNLGRLSDSYILSAFTATFDDFSNESRSRRAVYTDRMIPGGRWYNNSFSPQYSYIVSSSNLSNFSTFEATQSNNNNQFIIKTNPNYNYFRFSYLDPVSGEWSKNDANGLFNTQLGYLSHAPTITVVSSSDTSLTLNIADTRATSSAEYVIFYGSLVTGSRPASATLNISQTQLTGTTYTINDLEDAYSYGINGRVQLPSIGWSGPDSTIFQALTKPKFGSHVLSASQLSNLLSGKLYDDGGKNDHHMQETNRYFTINPSTWVNNINLTLNYFTASSNINSSSIKVYTRTDSLNNSTPTLTKGWRPLFTNASAVGYVNDYLLSGNYMYLAAAHNFSDMFNNGLSVGATKNFAKYNMNTDKIESVGAVLNTVSYTLALSGTNLYVGGLFTTVNNVSSSYLFKVDTLTNAITTIGTKLNGAVNKMVFSGSDLYIAGAFTSASNTTNNGAWTGAGAFAASRFVRYNTLTNQFSQVSSSIGQGIGTGNVNSLRYYNNKIYLAQSAQQHYGYTFNGILVWDAPNNTWSRISASNGIGTNNANGGGDVMFSGSDIYMIGGGNSGYNKYSGSNNTWYYNVASIGGFGSNGGVIHQGKLYTDNHKVYDIVNGTYLGTFASYLKAGDFFSVVGDFRSTGIFTIGNKLYLRNNTTQNIDFIHTASYTNSREYSPLVYLDLDVPSFNITDSNYKLLAEFSGTLPESSSYTFTASNLVLNWYANASATRQKGFDLDWSSSFVVPQVSGTALVLSSSASTAIKSGSLLDPGATFVGYPVNDTKSFIIQPTRKTGTKAVNNVKLKLNKLNIRENDCLRVYKAKDSSYLTASLPLATDGTLTGSNFVLLKTIVSGSTEFANTNSITGSDHVVITWRAS